MGASLLFGVLKNNWQLAALLVSIVTGAAFWKGEHELLLHTRTELAAQVALVNEAQSKARTQAAAAATADAQHKAESDVIQSQLQSAYKAHALTSDALSAAVVRYENYRSTCALSGTSAAAAGGLGARPVAAASGSAATTIGALVKACQHDEDELRACQAFARTCGAPQRPLVGPEGH